MLEVRNLNAGYGKLQILFDISLSVQTNKITTIVGPNGSGKSTFLKVLFGLADIYSGTIIYDSKDITNVPPHEKVNLKIAFLPQTDNVFMNLTVEENLMIAGYTLSSQDLRNQYQVVFSIFPELKSIMKRKAMTLSGGQRQFLAMGMALVRKARFLMLDEPTAQLSPKLAEVIFEKIIDLRDQLKCTILLVEQNAKRALEISDNAFMFVSGSVSFQGTAYELLHHKKFEQYFLGIKT